MVHGRSFRAVRCACYIVGSRRPQRPPATQNERTARFSFPDRRHFSFSEVYTGVRVPSRLILCPSSLRVLRSVSRSVLLPAILSVRGASTSSAVPSQRQRTADSRRVYDGRILFFFTYLSVCSSAIPSQ